MITRIAGGFAQTVLSRQGLARDIGLDFDVPNFERRFESRQFSRCHCPSKKYDNPSCL